MPGVGRAAEEGECVPQIRDWTGLVLLRVLIRITLPGYRHFEDVLTRILTFKSPAAARPQYILLRDEVVRIPASGGARSGFPPAPDRMPRTPVAPATETNYCEMRSRYKAIVFTMTYLQGPDRRIRTTGWPPRTPRRSPPACEQLRLSSDRTSCAALGRRPASPCTRTSSNRELARAASVLSLQHGHAAGSDPVYGRGRRLSRRET